LFAKRWYPTPPLLWPCRMRVLSAVHWGPEYSSYYIKASVNILRGQCGVMCIWGTNWYQPPATHPGSIPQDVYCGLSAQTNVDTRPPCIVPSVCTWPGWEWCRACSNVCLSIEAWVNFLWLLHQSRCRMIVITNLPLHAHHPLLETWQDVCWCSLIWFRTLLNCLCPCYLHAWPQIDSPGSHIVHGHGLTHQAVISYMATGWLTRQSYRTWPQVDSRGSHTIHGHRLTHQTVIPYMATDWLTRQSYCTWPRVDSPGSHIVHGHRLTHEAVIPYMATGWLTRQSYHTWPQVDSPGSHIVHVSSFSVVL